MIRNRWAARPLPLQALARGLVAGVSTRPVLPRLADVHPGSPAGGRWLGLQSVATASIRGTASSVVRGPDFRPVRGGEPADWRFRSARLECAARYGAVLPPIQLVRAGGDYWVVDGHNRVALARERGQVWIDADVTEVDLRGNNQAAAAAKEN